MIFGRPGSGKSTFAYSLAKQTKLPLYHLDKYFFVAGWIERNNKEFMKIQEDISKKSCWIIDGNSTRSLETRWQHADLVLYFNYSKTTCLFRLLKRLFVKPTHIDDRADNCPEILRFKLLAYMWTFETRVKQPIATLKSKYPAAKFIEINSDKDLEHLRNTVAKYKPTP